MGERKMLALNCRLCSADSGLISLFNGKSRDNRDYIRKLVEITTGIKFEKDDAFKHICYPCTVQVYNFFIFMTKSSKNERLLEAHITKNEKRKSNKFKICDLDAIPVPEISELQYNLAPWLISKQKDFGAVNNVCDDSTSTKTPERNNVTNSATITIEMGTQCDMVRNSDIPKNIVHDSTQTDVSKISLSKSVQCMIFGIRKHTQTNRISIKSSEIQCCLQETKDTTDSETQTHINTSEKYTRFSEEKIENDNNDSETQTDLNTLERYNQFNEENTRDNSKDSETQTDLLNISVYTQFNESCEGRFEEADFKCYLVDVKQEPQSMSPLIISPSNCLSINSSPVKNNDPSPIQSVPSPTLLTLRKKSQDVIICRHCGQSLYSKADYNLHMKIHMTCSFCKKKFRSMKRIRWHLSEECEVKQIMDKKPVVKLVKLRMSDTVQKECMGEFINIIQNGKRGVRMRSRSTSSVESVYSCCSLCRNPVSILHDLKLGVNKAVQTGLLFDSLLVTGLVNGNVARSSLRKREGLTPSPKRVKLSHSCTK